MIMKVDKSNLGVCFNEESHKYWVDGTDLNCISVTTIIHKFCQPFDEEFWSAYKAIEKIMGKDFKIVKSVLLSTKVFEEKILSELNIDVSLFNLERNTILSEWETKRNESCIRGTKIHAEHEFGHYGENTPEIEKLGLGGKFFCEKNYYDLSVERGIFPEYLISYIDGEFRLAGQLDLIIKDGNDIYIIDYKGLDIETPILTTNGFKLLKDISKEDIIFDKDGNETNIKNISEIHYNPCYKIKFDNGDEIIADHEHRWLVSFRQGKDKFKELILTTEELKNSHELYLEKQSSQYLPKIINSKSLNREKTKLPIDPYILGYWLGDGTSVAGSITCLNQNFWEEVIKRGYSYGENIGGEDHCELRTIFGLRTELGKLNLLSNKHIPNIYLMSSYEQRLDLLRGFMDADGYYNPKRKRFVMATTREYQADYLVTLLATLGVKPSKIYAKKYCNGKEFDGWDVCFTMKDNPFLIRNQEGIELPEKDKSSFRNIKSIELVETIPTKCLEVDSPSHTFLFGKSLIVTHNTNKKLDTKSYFNTKSKKHTCMLYPLNDLMDCNMVHYQMQLSTYAWMLQKINPEFVIKKLLIIHYDHDGNETEHELEYIPESVEKMITYHKKLLYLEQQKEKRRPIKF